MLLTVVIMAGFIIAGVLCMLKVDMVILKIVILASSLFFLLCAFHIDTLDDFCYVTINYYNHFHAYQFWNTRICIILKEFTELILCPNSN